MLLRTTFFEDAFVHSMEVGAAPDDFFVAQTLAGKLKLLISGDPRP